MKQELPIAICLLAAGASIWLLNRPATAVDGDLQRSGAASLKTVTKQPKPQEIIEITSADADAPQLIAKPLVNRNGDLSIGNFRSTKGNAAAAKLLAETFESIQASPAFQSRIEVEAMLFGQTVVGEGVYFQLGKGRGQSRIDLNLSVGQKQHQMTHLCDGRYVYRLNKETTSGKQELQFYDLQRLQGQRQAYAQPGVAKVAKGDQLFSGVNLPGLIDHLRLSFDFFVVPHADSAETHQTLLRGSWKPAPLQQLIKDLFDAEAIQNGVAWRELPRQLPHAAEISLKRQTDGSWFPNQITFYQFETQSRSSVARPSVAIKYSDRILKPDLSADLFVMSTMELEASDVTHQYLSRLRSPTDANDSDLRR